MIDISFQFLTYTATLAFFDEDALQHRLDERVDWWTMPSSELAEANEGNLLILWLGSDGVHGVHLREGTLLPHDIKLSANLRCPSGRLYVGPGEDIVGDGIGPSETAYYPGGQFLSLSPGNYCLQVAPRENYEIEVALFPTEERPTNQLTEPFYIEWD